MYTKIVKLQIPLTQVQQLKAKVRLSQLGDSYKLPQCLSKHSLHPGQSPMAIFHDGLRIDYIHIVDVHEGLIARNIWMWETMVMVITILFKVGP